MTMFIQELVSGEWLNSIYQVASGGFETIEEAMAVAEEIATLSKRLTRVVEFEPEPAHGMFDPPARTEVARVLGFVKGAT